jgi:histidinol-phosphatase (PHP family)
MDLIQQELSLAALNQQFLSFLDEARRLKALYAPRISLLVGLETEYITPRDLDELSQILERHQPDIIEYIVGSVHHVNGVPIDFDETICRRAVATFSSGGHGDEDEDGGGDKDSLEKFLLAYFDAQYELLRQFKPEIVGHIDLCRLYTPELEFKKYPTVWERIERNVKYAIDYGALFEVNAAAFRKKWDTAYPGPDIAGVSTSFYILLHHLYFSAAHSTTRRKVCTVR